VESISIYTAGDVNYRVQVGALSRSILASQSKKIVLTVLGLGWDSKSKATIERLQTECFIVKFIDIEINEFKNVKLSHKFPLATIYNLIGPKYFFSNLEKILYVDSDVIFNDDIAELWNQELNFPVAAVIDSHIGVIGNPSMKRPWRELKVDPLAKYLNTGLLLIDVAKWNEQQITEKCLEILRSHEMPCIDQDALSLVLGGNFDTVHPRYNLMPFHLTPRLRFSDIVESPTDLKEALSNPAVIHFHRSFFGKPWNYGCTHPYKNLWREFATQFDSGWSKKFDLYNLIRNYFAKLVGLTILDSTLNSNERRKNQP
jgi:lipopolysaccharide biosynthesis glycosyltransferase